MWAQWGHSTSKIILHTNSHFTRKRACTARILPIFCRRGFVAVSFDFAPSRPFLRMGIPASASLALRALGALVPAQVWGREGHRGRGHTGQELGGSWREGTQGTEETRGEGGSVMEMGRGRGEGKGKGGVALSIPPHLSHPRPTDLIISGVLQININDPATEFGRL